jgi:hypothetical protein
MTNNLHQDYTPVNFYKILVESGTLQTDRKLGQAKIRIKGRKLYNKTIR